MSRRNKFLIGLTGFIVLLGLSYANLPWILTSLIKHNLSARGLSDVQLRVDTPSWRGVRIHSLAFTAMIGEQPLSCEVPELEVAYHLAELMTGTVSRIRVPIVAMRFQSTAVQSKLGSAPSEKSNVALALVPLLSGQWLSQLPVDELLLEQISVDGRLPSDDVFTLQLSGHLRETTLQLKGDIQLPAPQKPIVFSLSAGHTGEARLLFMPAGAAEPVMSLAVNPAAIDPDAITINQAEHNSNEFNGVLSANLTTLIPVLMPLVPMLAPGLTGMESVSGLEGDLTSQWQLQVTDSNWQVKGEALHTLGGVWRDQTLPRAELRTQFDVDPQRVALQSTLTVIDQAIVLETKGEHQFARGEGHADLTLRPVVFSKTGFVLSRLRKDWSYPFDITAGQVSASGRLVWQKAMDRPLEPQLVITLDKLGGHYNNMAFAGLSGEMALALVKGGVRTNKDAQLHVDVVDVGFPVEKIDVRFALALLPQAALSLVKVQQFNAQLLGGRAHSDPFELDSGREKNAFVVQLEQIALNEIMKLEQQEGLRGSGVLDGQIPIEISSDGIVVNHGRLAARAPGGKILYTPTAKVAAMAQSNASVNIVVKALSDFHYEVLDVDADYKPGGDLKLQVRLEGKNPDWQGGQPIHLNLNLEENIPTLLRSLQLSSDISDQVQKRYQKAP